jgi:hypothetical protein
MVLIHARMLVFRQPSLLVLSCDCLIGFFISVENLSQV